MKTVNLCLSLFFQDADNVWWDAFATEFFDDDATLTLSFCLEDGPKRYCMSCLDCCKTLDEYFYITLYVHVLVFAGTNFMRMGDLNYAIWQGIKSHKNFHKC